MQRRDILKAVLERDDHPSADQVYESLVGRIPGLSRTTVYRVLNVLVDMGVVRRLHHPGTAVRFDGRIDRHHHLVCRICGKVIDIYSTVLDEVPLPEVPDEEFQIDDFSVHFTGVCADCRRSDAS